MSEQSLRVLRKVKIDGKWQMTAVPVVKGKPDPGHVLHKGKLTPVTGGTFYLDHGHGINRKRITCGKDPESVKRAFRTQAHVIELRRHGMDVGDAPEVGKNRSADGPSLREIAKAFKAEPPTGYTKKTVSKHDNAYRVFAEYAASLGIYSSTHVTRQTITKWIAHQLKTLDASTVVPKVSIVIAELKRHGKEITLEERDLPKVVEREREIYTLDELEALFNACDLDEFELFQTYLISGMRNREVAFLTVPDMDAIRTTLKVTAKRDLGFTPKTYEEREVPVTTYLISLLLGRIERLQLGPKDLLFGTSRNFFKRGDKGGKADKKHLEKLKQVARRSWLNCGHCHGTYKNKPVTCATHAICKRWGLHKFRHTYATSMLRDNVDIVTVSKWLGHKDLATTRIYLRALEAEMAQPQVENSTLAKKFAGKAPLTSERARLMPRGRSVGC